MNIKKQINKIFASYLKHLSLINEISILFEKMCDFKQKAWVAAKYYTMAKILCT